MNKKDFDLWLLSINFTWTELRKLRVQLQNGHKVIVKSNKEVLHKFYIAYRETIITQLCSSPKSNNLVGRELSTAYKIGIIDARQFSEIMKAYVRKKYAHDEMEDKRKKGDTTAVWRDENAISCFSLVELE